MPTYALTESGEPIHVKAASRNVGWGYSCPYCSRPMTVVGGDLTQYRKHFRHRPDESCYDYGSGGETRRHLEGKSEIEYHLLESSYADDIQVEIQSGAVTPDVQFVSGDKQIGIELQVSGITASDLKTRTRQRSAEGLYTLWLFDSGAYRSETVSKDQNRYIQFQTGEQSYLDMCGFGESSYIHYFDQESGGVGVVQRYSVFEDGGGGWPEYTTPIEGIGTWITSEGYRLAGAPCTEPANLGDEEQARLF